jgi:hypothetical protein
MGSGLTIETRGFAVLDYLSRDKAFPLGRSVSLPLIAFIGVRPCH